MTETGLPILFRQFGVSATMTPAGGGDPVACTVIIQRQIDDIAAITTRATHESILMTTRDSEATPQEGDGVTAEGNGYTIREIVGGDGLTTQFRVTHDG